VAKVVVYVIGTNHELQHNRTPMRGDAVAVTKGREEFREFLRRSIVQAGVSLVAEEAVKEVLDMIGAKSMVRDVAEELQIDHLYADMDAQTRVANGVPASGTENLPEVEKEKYHSLRENYWLENIRTHIDKGVIFVCGAEHVLGFEALLKSQGIETMVLEEYFGAEIYSA
jgi:hypothetical protein